MNYEELKALRAKTAKQMRLLTPRERRVLRLRFGFQTGSPITLRAISYKLGVTPERVRQIEHKALRKLYGKGTE